MKKPSRWLLVLGVFLALVMILAGFLSVAFFARQNDLALVTPPTLEDLQALDVQLDPSSEKRAPQTSEDAGATVVNLDESGSASTLPARLARALSPEELAAKFKRDDPQKRSVFRQECGAVVLRVFGKKASILELNIGLNKLGHGDWDSARLHLWAAIDAGGDPSVLQYASAKLAWLEDDPEKAARYLELSCQGDGGWLNTQEQALRNAVSLCKATGSTALKDHYSERLRALYPDEKY